MLVGIINGLARHAHRVAQVYDDEDYEPAWYEPRRIYCVALLIAILCLMTIDDWQLRLRGWKHVTPEIADEFGLHYPDLQQPDKKIREWRKE